MPADNTPDRFVAAGKIIREWGLQGALKILPFSSSFNSFFASLRVPCSAWIVPSGGVRILKTIDSLRVHGTYFIISFDDLHDCDSARSFRDAVIEIAREDLPPLREDEFYQDQIIGLTVHTPDGLNLGNVVEILHTGSNDVYVVRDGRKEYLIPAIRDVIREIDLSGKRITIDPLKGLID